MGITIDELADTIMQGMKNYTEEADQKMQDCIDAVTKDALAQLENDPGIPKRTKKYAKGFYFKNLARGRGYKRNIVANKKYQLTHLLENGHLTRRGTRTKAYPHWKKAQKIADTLPERIEEALYK